MIDPQLDGKVVLVSGANHGIAREVKTLARVRQALGDLAGP